MKATISIGIDELDVDLPIEEIEKLCKMFEEDGFECTAVVDVGTPDERAYIPELDEWVSP